jgi:hypothetical protein
MSEISWPFKLLLACKKTLCSMEQLNESTSIKFHIYKDCKSLYFMEEVSGISVKM